MSEIKEMKFEVCENHMQDLKQLYFQYTLNNSNDEITFEQFIIDCHQENVIHNLKKENLRLISELKEEHQFTKDENNEILKASFHYKFECEKDFNRLIENWTNISKLAIDMHEMELVRQSHIRMNNLMNERADYNKSKIGKSDTK